MEKSDSVEFAFNCLREGEGLTIYIRTQQSNRCFQGIYERGGGLPSGTQVRQLSVSVPWVKGLWLKEGMAKEGTKVLAIFQRGALAPQHNPIFQPVRNQGFKKTSHSCCYGRCLLTRQIRSAMLWFRLLMQHPEFKCSLTLRFLTSVRWNHTYLGIKFSVQLKSTPS